MAEHTETLCGFCSSELRQFCALPKGHRGPHVWAVPVVPVDLAALRRELWGLRDEFIRDAAGSVSYEEAAALERCAERLEIRLIILNLPREGTPAEGEASR